MVVVQYDLDQLVIRRRRQRRAMSIAVVMLMMSLSLGAMRSCGSQFNHPYNKGYTPLDTARPANGEQP